MGSTGLQSARAGHYQEADVLIGVAMWPVVLSQPVGQRVDVPCEGSCIFSTLSVALLEGCRTDPVALRIWMVSEMSNDITIAFGCRITFPLQSLCATITILTLWLCCDYLFRPQESDSATFVLVSYHQGDEVQRRHSGPRL